LKQEKIVWENFHHDDDIWDPSYYSHKLIKAGLNYELAIALSTGRLVWMNGPFPAGTNDVSIFVKHGLHNDKLLSLGKKAIGDGGYVGHSETVSTPNAHDSYGTKKFKSRALKRH
jgi:hypothetical protein